MTKNKLREAFYKEFAKIPDQVWFISEKSLDLILELTNKEKTMKMYQEQLQIINFKIHKIKMQAKAAERDLQWMLEERKRVEELMETVARS